MGRRLLIGLLVGVAALAGAASASAADSIYWGNLEVTHLGRAALTGGGADFSPAPVAAKYGIGTAIDAAAGKIYWADAGSERILSANLDGSGSAALPTGTATVSAMHGLAIDPPAGKVFWADPGAGKISYANLDGSGGADLNTGAAPTADPQDVAVDPGTNRLYWVNYEPPSIGYVDLAGGGSGALAVPPGLLTTPDGIAIDPTANRLYWTNAKFGATPSIGWASLGGPGGGLLPIAPTTLAGPLGLAIDPGAGRLYWANEEGNSIASAALDGSGAAFLDTSGTMPFAPAYPALLKSPEAAGAPVLSGSSTVGSSLTCAPATWAADPVGTGLSWAPQSTATEWTLNGSALNGATGPTLTATQAGSYACRSIATNGAGSTPATSATITVAAPATTPPPPTTVSLLRVKLDKRHGTATVLAKVSGPGTLTMTGKKVVRRSVKASGAGIAKLKVASKGGALKTLIKAGKVKVRITLRFLATEGARAAATRKLTLRRLGGGRGTP